MLLSLKCLQIGRKFIQATKFRIKQIKNHFLMDVLPMKKYAIVVDISPSEQLNENDNEIKFMALLFGLRSTTSFDEVGSKYPVKEKQYLLRKWSGSSAKYKEGFIKHAKVLNDSGNIMFEINVASNRVIRNIGKRYWELIMGKLPAPIRHNSKNRPLVRMGGYKVDGKIIPQWDILVDDLCVLGWYAEAVVSCLKKLVEINGERVKLDVLIDNLPNEQGEEDYYKGTLLKQICKKASDGLLVIVGVPSKSDTMQRELLVDCMAGLYREIEEDGKSPYKEVECPPNFRPRVC